MKDKSINGKNNTNKNTNKNTKKNIINNIVNNIYVINLDSSKDRLESIKKQLDKQKLNFTRIPAINGKQLTEKEIEKNCTQFAQMFCPRNIIGCAMSHKAVWQRIIDNGDDYAIVLEDDCKLVKNFKHKLNHCLKELMSFDPKWDFLYLGYFGPAKCKNETIMNSLQRLILHKINKECNKKYFDLKHVFIPVSPVGFHSYIISNKCAKELLKRMEKINYHIDAEFLKYTQDLHVYATKDKLGNQFSTVDNSTLNEYKFPKILNWYSDAFQDLDGISYSYWFGSPIIQVIDFPINLYFIMFALLSIVSNAPINILFFIYIFLELSLDVNNINIIIPYIIYLIAIVLRN